MIHIPKRLMYIGKWELHWLRNILPIHHVISSFGVVLWELVERKDPYQGLNPLQVPLLVAQEGMMIIFAYLHFNALRLY